MKKIAALLSILFPFLVYSQCDTVGGKRSNLGLYGGKITELTLSRTTNRLFCGTEASNNFFYSDDAAQTWHNPFPYDSMFFDCGRGWAGVSQYTQTNHKGWVANRTLYGVFSSVQISFDNGDSGSFRTALDQWMVNYTLNNIKDVELTDYFVYACIGRYIAKVDTNYFDSLKCRIDVNNYYLLSNPNSIKIISITAVNNSNGYPILMALDTVDNLMYANLLLKYDGTNYTKINVPNSKMKITDIKLPQFSVSADTIFVVGMDSSETQSLMYRSYDGGSTWTTISGNNTSSKKLDLSVFKTEYGEQWKIDFPQSNGHLILSKYHYSTDLGNTWIQSQKNVLPSAMSYADTSYIFLSGGGEKIYTKDSYTHNSAPFIYKQDLGLEALTINGISQSNGKVYITTDLGIGFTNAYKDASIVGPEKWDSIYGIFPIANSSLSSIPSIRYYAIKISPFDSSHVIAGGVYGFAVTKLGPGSFIVDTPGFNVGHTFISDIEFITDDIVLASDTASRIWRSTDGGLTWSYTSWSPNYISFNGLSVSYTNIDTLVFAVSGACADSGFLWRSNDLGLSWNKINYGPAIDSFASIPFRNVIVDPDKPERLYIVGGCNINNVQQGEFLVSHDSGYSFIDTLSLSTNTAYALAINTSNTDTVYIAAGHHVYEYYQIADSLKVMYSGLINEVLSSIEYGSVLVGSTTGFYSIELEGIDNIITHNQNSFYQSKLFNIYPNPAKDKVFVKMLSENKNVNIELINVLGKKISIIKKGTINKNEIIETDIHDLPSGIYFIQITCDDNMSSIKLVIE